MLSKLAFKNALKSIKDYGVYLFTLVLGVGIFYMFNSIYAQKEIITVTEATETAMRALQKILSYLSVFVSVILGLLIVYANNFFIKRRKKEFGIYMTLGMDKGGISIILMLETSIMALMALVVGLILGVFGSQMMSIFTAKLFEADLSSYRFIFSYNAAVKSIIYFGIIFLTVILFNTFSISKLKLIDLIYGGRKNEMPRIKSMKISTAVFVFSLLCLVAAYTIILKNGIIKINLWFLLSIILGILGTVLFFMSLSGFIVLFMQYNKGFYYKNINIFVLRQFSSKINTNFISISVICLLLFLVISIFSSGYSMQSLLSNEIRTSFPYDYSLVDYNYNDDENTGTISDRLPSDIADSKLVANSYEYSIGKMKNGKALYGDYSLDFPKTLFKYEETPLQFISISDYNALRQMKGMSKVVLTEQNYLIIYDREMVRDVAEQFYDKSIELNFAGNTLVPLSPAENFVLSNIEYASITFVVADSFLGKMDVGKKVLNINCVNKEAAREFGVLLDNYNVESDQVRAFIYYSSRQQLYDASVVSKVSISFLAIYLGAVFMITCAAILAIQQLSEVADNIKRYDLLNKLGVEQGMLNHALFVQILSYFLLPLLLAAVHSVIGLIVVNKVIKLFGKIDIGFSLSATAIFILLIYGLYFLLTYIGSKGIVNKR
ncbi:FtsX-like permease family protein [Johnsonella ignava]|mgnify:FL=1|uniref:FtsX-like permease family protein n=1 Tax=Johnsonella ignava TaxID=43995 RepID=UPI0023F05410|nr:ABC transporter permease [Johnsonella ignava]